MDIKFRTNLVPSDKEDIREILESTKVFFDFEIEVALEIIDDGLKRGSGSGYSFIVAESGKKAIGYVNFGPSPCTQISWDVYWIAVSKTSMNLGLGKTLLKMAEDEIKAAKGVNIWVETSSRKEYDPTRAFYHKQGYKIASELIDFYSPGDNKVTFHKMFAENLPGETSL